MRASSVSGRRRRDQADDSRLHVLTWQIGLWAAVLVVGTVVVTTGVLVSVYLRQTTTETDAVLAAAATRITDPQTAPLGTYLAIDDGGTVRVTPGMPAGLPDSAAMAEVGRTGRPVQRVVDMDPSGASFVLRTSRMDGRVVQVVLDQTQVEEGRERLVRALTIAGAIGVVLAAAAATVLARRAVRPMAETIRMQRRFVADASHELRTPVTLLSTRAQMLARRLRREAAEPRVRQDAEGLVDDVTALTEILDDLLLAADLGHDEAREVVDVAALVEGVVATASSHASAVALELRPVVIGLVDGDLAGTRPTVLANPVALRRAVLALVDNALEHARSRVDVTVAVERRVVVVAVSDDGPGIPPELVSSVFRRFSSGARGSQEVTPTGRRHYGLGLALVAEVVARHGGSVRAGTAPTAPGRRPGGAVLEIRLPRRR